MLRKLCSNSVTSQCLIWQGLCPSNSLLRFPYLLVPLVNQTHYLSLSASGDKQFDTQNKTIDESDINPEAIKLQKTFNCTIAEAAKVYEFLSTNSDGVDLNQINKTLKWLNRCGATLPVMLINCHIFLCSSSKSHWLFDFDLVMWGALKIFVSFSYRKYEGNIQKTQPKWMGTCGSFCTDFNH